MDVGYAQSFYNAAAAFKLSAGLNERRANVTLGYSITPKQQIKLTYEYLAQNLPFDYSTGTVNEWVNQNAFGAAYRYMLDYGIVRALEVYGNYTKASSKELSDVEMYTDNQLTQIDQRRIAGGTQQNYGAAVTLTPFQNTILKVGGGYSSLSFATQWSDPQKQSAIAYNAELSHLLTPKTMVSAGIGNTAAGQTYTGKVSRILPWSLEGALTGQYMATTNDIPGSTSVTASLSYPAPKTYANVFEQGMGNLKSWVEQPVIYNTRVLAKAEERKLAVGITQKANIPNQTIPVSTSLPSALPTQDYFSFNQEVYSKINYTLSTVIKGTTTAVPDNLNLSIKQIDSWNAQVVSSPTTQTMIPNGQNTTYTVTLQAAGYRNGQVVLPTTSIPFEVTVTPYASLNAASWVNNPTLPPAKPGENYNNGTPIPLLPLITNTATPGENFKFTLDNSQAPWVSLTTGDYNQSLTATPNMVVDKNLTIGQVPITLTATSMASGHPAKPEKEIINITINSNVYPPTWKSADLQPAATPGQVYTPTTLTNYVNPYYPGSTGQYLNKTKNAAGDLPNDTLKFTPDTTTTNKFNPCGDWLKINPDTGNPYTTDPVPLDATSCNIYMDVQSLASPPTFAGVSHLGPKAFNINAIIYTLPDWKNGVNTFLPNRITIGTNTNSYIVIKDTTTGGPYPETILGPYTSGNAGLLSQTLYPNKTPVTDDTITFSIDTKGAGTCSDLYFKDADPAGQSTTGTLTGKITNTCNVILTVQSKIASGQPPFTLPTKTITAVILPTWSPTGLPSVSVLSSYPSQPLNTPGNNTPLKPTQDSSGSLLPDKLNNFQIDKTRENGCSWITSVDPDTGIIQGTPQTQGKCNISLSAHSLYQNQDFQLPTTSITVNDSSAPAFQYPLQINLNYDSNTTVNSTKIYLANYLVNPYPGVDYDPSNIGSNNSDLVTPNKINKDTSGSYIEIQPLNNDGSQVDNLKLNYYFSAVPTLNGVSGSPGVFNLMIIANMTSPSINKDYYLPNPKLTSANPTYTADLNPYDPNGCFTSAENTTPAPCMTTTKFSWNGNTVFQDKGKLTFNIISPQKEPKCDWVTQDNLNTSTGIITATIPTDQYINTQDQKCYISFNVTSYQNQSAGPSIGYLTVQFPYTAPTISNTAYTGNNAGKTPAIAFDDNTNVIRLNDYVPSTAQIPGLKFTFKDGSNIDPTHNWKINQVGSDYYLVRQPNDQKNNTYDASTVTQQEILDIKAWNAFVATENPNENPNFSVTIKHDSGVTLRLNDAKKNYKLPPTVVNTTPAATYQIFDSTNPGNSVIQTIAADQVTPVVGDIITTPNPMIVNGNSKHNIATFTNGTNITVSTTLDPDKDPGVYPSSNDPSSTYPSAKLTQPNSIAKGETAKDLDLTGYLTVTITTPPAWKQTSYANSMKFDAFNYTDTTTNSGAISLNNLINSANNVVNLQFKFDTGGTLSSDNRFEIFNDNTGGKNDWYLIRHRTLGTDGKTMIVDASDVNSTPTYNISVCSGDTCNSAPFTITVLPDSAVTLQTSQVPGTPYSLETIINRSSGQASYTIYNNADPVNSIIQTVAPAPDKITLVSGDILTSTQPMVTNGTHTIASYSNSQIVIPTSGLTGSDLGSYPNPTSGSSIPTLFQPSSVAKGGVANNVPLAGFLTIGINGWTNTNLPVVMKFDSIDTTNAGDGTTGAAILLNNTKLSNINQLSNPRYQFSNGKLISDDGNFQIYQNGNNWYLLRKTNKSGTTEYIDALDVNNSPSLNIQICSGTSYCDSGTTMATQVLPDTDPQKVIIQWKGPLTMTVPNSGSSSKQCYTAVYDKNNPLGSNLATVVKGYQVRDYLTMACMPNGGVGVGGDAYLGVNPFKSKKIGYLGGSAAADGKACDYTFIVSQPKLNDQDQNEYKGFGSNTNTNNSGNASYTNDTYYHGNGTTTMTYDPLVIINLNSRALGGYFVSPFSIPGIAMIFDKSVSSTPSCQ